MLPTIPSSWLLFIYALAIITVSLLGGYLPRWIRFTHTRLQMLISFVGGLMIGIAIFHMLPHALHGLGGERINEVSWAVMVGLVLMFFLLRFFHFHQHQVEDPWAEPSEHANQRTTQDGCGGHHHDHHHHLPYHTPHEHSHPLSAVSWIGMLFGLGIHTFLDGVALASTMQVEAGHGHASVGLAGFGVFLAIFLHKPLDAMSRSSLMRAQGASGIQSTLVNMAFACLVPLGAACVVIFGDRSTWLGSSLAGWGLAFSAGVFLCISLSDLLPEMEFHSHHRLPLSIALLLGIAVAWGVGFLEPQHLHHVEGGEPTHHHPEDHHHHHPHDGNHSHPPSPVQPGADASQTSLVQPAKRQVSSWHSTVQWLRQQQGVDLVWEGPVDEPAFQALAGCDRLQSLSLSQAQLSDAVAPVLATLHRLQRLRLDGAILGDESAAALGTLPSLQAINLPDCRISEHGLRHWEKLPNLVQLRLGSPLLGDQGLEVIGRFHHLRFLHLIEVPITDAGLLHLGGMDQLESFYLDGSQASDRGLARLLTALPKLHFHRDQQHLPNDPGADDHSSK